MNSFNPSKYSYSADFSSSRQENDDSFKSYKSGEVEKNSLSSDLVEKGHKNIMKVDLDKFDEICKRFKDKKDTKIKNLAGQDKQDFDLAVSYVHLLYGTTYYTQLYERAKKHFKNVTSVKHGTLGSYFAGCAIGNAGLAGCSLGCAGNMPLPKDEDSNWSFCDKAVILAEKNKGGYNFSVVKPADSEDQLDPAYLFVESNSVSDFKGFNGEEKLALKSLGAKKLKVVGYNSDMKYSDIYREPKSVDEIKHRKNYDESLSESLSNSSFTYSNEDQNNDWWWLLLVIIFLVLVIIALMLTYKYYKM